MCIMFLDQRKTKGTEAELVPRDWFDRCRKRHPHGMGIMHPDGQGNLAIWTTMSDIQGLYDRYKAAREAGHTVAVHFRRGTAGSDNELVNCHPFEIVPGKLAYMHNGTIGKLDKYLKASTEKGISDTRYLRDNFLAHLPPDFLSNPLFVQVLEDFYFFTDRAIFMTADGESWLFNDKSNGAYWTQAKDAEGKTYNGLWWSHDKDKAFIERGVDVVVYNGGSTGYSGSAGAYYNEQGKFVKYEYHVRSDTQIRGVKGDLYGFFNYGVVTDKWLEERGSIKWGTGIIDGHPLYAVMDHDWKSAQPAMFATPLTMDHRKIGTRGDFWEVSGATLDALKKLLGGDYYECVYTVRMTECEQLAARKRKKKEGPLCWLVTTFIRFKSSGAAAQTLDDRRCVHVVSGSWREFLTLMLTGKGPTKPVIVTPPSTIGFNAHTRTQHATSCRCHTCLAHKPDCVCLRCKRYTKPAEQAVTSTTTSTVKEPEAKEPKVTNVNDDTPRVSGPTAMGVPAVKVWDKAMKPVCPWCKSDEHTERYITTGTRSNGSPRGTRYCWCESCAHDFIEGLGYSRGPDGQYMIDSPMDPFDME